jgi:hypothetical protein
MTRDAYAVAGVRGAGVRGQMTTRRHREVSLIERSHLPSLSHSHKQTAINSACKQLSIPTFAITYHLQDSLQDSVHSRNNSISRVSDILAVHFPQLASSREFVRASHSRALTMTTPLDQHLSFCCLCSFFPALLSASILTRPAQAPLQWPPLLLQTFLSRSACSSSCRHCSSHGSLAMLPSCCPRSATLSRT